MKKVTLSLVAGMAIIGIGLPAWASTQPSSSKNPSSESSQTLTTTAKRSTSSKATTQDSKETSTITPSSSKADNSSVKPEDALSKNKNEFNAQAIQQNFYLKTVSNAGEVSYTKATEDALKTLESERETNDLKVTQVQYQGELITVID